VRKPARQRPGLPSFSATVALGQNGIDCSDSNGQSIPFWPRETVAENEGSPGCWRYRFRTRSQTPPRELRHGRGASDRTTQRETGAESLEPRRLAGDHSMRPAFMLATRNWRWIMPEKKTIERARQDKREGKAPSTQAGEFVKE